MRVLVVGGGGREHALVHSFSRSSLRPQVFCAPGNAGIAAEADCVPIGAEDLDGLLDFAARERPDLTVVGPEAPLVAGLADLFRERGLRVFGPDAPAARIEGSKVFAKEVMDEAGAPTGAYSRHIERRRRRSRRSPRQTAYPVVVKADGLAAGKGVIIAADEAEARAAVEDMLVAAAFGDAGDVVLIEEHLVGSEVSLLVLCDGETAVPLATAQDYKRIVDGDQGPNTGGMGSYCPCRAFGPDGRRRRHGHRRRARARRPADGAASPTAACSTPASCSPPTDPRSSSSTAASATPRRRSCCRASRATCWSSVSRQRGVSSPAPCRPGRRRTASPSSWPQQGTRRAATKAT